MLLVLLIYINLKYIFWMNMSFRGDASCEHCILWKGPTFCPHDQHHSKNQSLWLWEYLEINISPVRQRYVSQYPLTKPNQSNYRRTNHGDARNLQDYLPAWIGFTCQRTDLQHDTFFIEVQTYVIQGEGTRVGDLRALSPIPPNSSIKPHLADLPQLWEWKVAPYLFPWVVLLPLVSITVLIMI